MKPHILYRFYDASDQLLYVGLTCDPGSRWQNHERGKQWWSDVARVTVEHHPNRASVVKAEARAIRDEHPLHNITQPSCEPPDEDVAEAVSLIAEARDVTQQRNQAIAKLVHVHHLTLRDAAGRLGLSHELVRRIANRTPQAT